MQQHAHVHYLQTGHSHPRPRDNTSQAVDGEGLLCGRSCAGSCGARASTCEHTPHNTAHTHVPTLTRIRQLRAVHSQNCSFIKIQWVGTCPPLVGCRHAGRAREFFRIDCLLTVLAVCLAACLRVWIAITGRAPALALHLTSVGFAAHGMDGSMTQTTRMKGTGLPIANTALSCGLGHCSGRTRPRAVCD